MNAGYTDYFLDPEISSNECYGISHAMTLSLGAQKNWHLKKLWVNHIYLEMKVV